MQLSGLSMGLRINATKCELISQGSLEGFPADMKRQHDPNVEILGAPIGDVIFCAKFWLKSIPGGGGGFNRPSNCTAPLTAVCIIL